jgi:peptidoglycan hydrolase CwlO-like protein
MQPMLVLLCVVLLAVLAFMIVRALKEETMAKFEDVQAALDAVDTETDRIAAEVEDLKGQIGAGMTPEQEDAIKARLDALSTRLKAIGKDPENPVPEPEPTPEV